MGNEFMVENKLENYRGRVRILSSTSTMKKIIKGYCQENADLPY